MLGSHNSYTYLSSDKSLYNRFTSLWRCQTKTIKEQYDAGVRFFDIRVTEIKEKGRTFWQCCHGKVNLKVKYINLGVILSQISKYEGAMCRLVLEKGDEEDFRKQILTLADKYKCLVYAAIKKPWRVMLDRIDGKFKLIDYTYIPWNTGDGFFKNLLNFKFSTIKKWAEGHNPQLTDEMRNDMSTCYFMDYV